MLKERFVRFGAEEMMRRVMKNPEKIADNVALVLAPKYKEEIVDKLYRERLDQAYNIVEPQDDKQEKAGVTVGGNVFAQYEELAQRLKKDFGYEGLLDPQDSAQIDSSDKAGAEWSKHGAP